MLNYNELFDRLKHASDWLDFLDNPDYDSIDSQVMQLVTLPERRYTS